MAGAANVNDLLEGHVTLDLECLDRVYLHATYAAVGFTNRSLCAQVRSLLGDPYTSAQMTYDLRRLRLKGLIRRAPAVSLD